MAGRFAKQVRAKSMVLTHFSNRFASRAAEGSVFALCGERTVNRTSLARYARPDEVTGDFGSTMVQEHSYPVIQDTSDMRMLVHSAQKSAQLHNVVAARDFMAFPVDPRPRPPPPPLR